MKPWKWLIIDAAAVIAFACLVVWYINLISDVGCDP